MRHAALPLAILFATIAIPARAQTCGGMVFFSLHAPGHVQQLLAPGVDFGMEATFVSHSAGATDAPPIPARFPVDSALAESRRPGSRFEVDERAMLSPLPAGTRIRLQPPLAFRWGCGLHAARFVFTRGAETMTLDLYGGPAQRSLRLEQPLPFRAGHFALDLSAPEARTDPSSRLTPVPE